MSSQPQQWAGFTPLHHAVFKGDEAEVERLLKAGHNPNAQDANGNTPLHLCDPLRGGSKLGPGQPFPSGPNTAALEAIARKLLDAGADPNLANKLGKTPLHYAASHPSGTGVVEILLDHQAKIDTTDAEGRTPLHWAADANIRAHIELLLERGADKTIRDLWGKAPSDLATDSECKALL